MIIIPKPLHIAHQLSLISFLIDTRHHIYHDGNKKGTILLQDNPFITSIRFTYATFNYARINCDNVFSSTNNDAVLINARCEYA